MFDPPNIGNPWTVPEHAFPTQGAIETQLQFHVNYAVLAPSNHNTQPWRFRVGHGTVDVLADRSRALPVIDPDDRLLTMSCGAALLNLVTAVRYFGREVWLQYLPEPGDPDLLARVRLGRSRTPDSNDEQLFRAIRRRRTTRLPYSHRRVPDGLLRRLIWLASEYDCWIHFIDDTSSRARLAELVTEGNRRQLEDDSFLAELDSWIRLDRDSARDGMPVITGHQNGYDKRSPLRTFYSRSNSPADEREIIDASPTLLVLGTNDDDPLTWVAAGQALQAMLLRATIEGVTGSYLGQPCDSPDLRDELRALCGRSGVPQTVLRLGYAPQIPASPRRPVSDVLI